VRGTAGVEEVEDEKEVSCYIWCGWGGWLVRGLCVLLEA